MRIIRFIWFLLREKLCSGIIYSIQYFTANKRSMDQGYARDTTKLTNVILPKSENEHASKFMS